MLLPCPKLTAPDPSASPGGQRRHRGAAGLARPAVVTFFGFLRSTDGLCFQCNISDGNAFTTTREDFGACCVIIKSILFLAIPSSPGSQPLPSAPKRE